MDNDYFYNYVMECIDLQGSNEELFSVQYLCDTCINNFHKPSENKVWFRRFIDWRCCWGGLCRI